MTVELPAEREPVFPPPQSMTASPNLSLLDEYTFQDFCADLWSPECKNAYVYGRRGQGQKGIDIFAFGRAGQSDGVGQCKRYQTFTDADLAKAMKEFQSHLEHWVKEGIRELKFFVSCACKDVNVLNLVRKITAELKQQEIEFEFLDAGRIISKLRRYPALVSQYIGPHWVEVLCGTRQTMIGTGDARDSAGSQILRDVIDEWVSGRNRELDDIREKFRCGAVEAAYKELIAFRDSSGWRHLSGELQSRAFRILASMELERNAGVDAARNWVEQARKADTKANLQIIEAVLAYEEGTAEDALAALGAPQTVEAWNVQLAIWLNQGHSGLVLKTIDDATFPPNEETIRLSAIAYLLQKNLSAALVASESSLKQNSNWVSLRHTRAMIQYASSVSTHFHAWEHLSWPIPPSRNFINADPATLGSLQNAANAFDKLLHEMSTEARDREIAETWKLASLANNPERDSEASEFATELISKNPRHYRAIIWALERRYEFDQDLVKSALLERISNEQHIELDALLAAISIMALGKEFEAIHSFLKQYKERFELKQASSIWRFMMAQVLCQLGQHMEATALAEEEKDAVFKRKIEIAILRMRSEPDRDYTSLSEILIRTYGETGFAEDLIDAAECCSFAGKWDWVVEHGDTLLSSFLTEGAFRLVIQAAWKAKKFDVGMSWLRRCRSLFGHRRFPADLSRIEIGCLRGLGRLQEASELANILVAEDGAPENALERFQTQFAMGDVSGCVLTARILLGSREVRPLPLLQVARILAIIDTAIAIELWEAAMERVPLDDDSVLLAYDLAHKLGLDHRTEPLLHEIHRISESGSNRVRQIDINDIRAIERENHHRLAHINRNYNSGAAPVHLISVMADWPIAALFHLQLELNKNAQSALDQIPVMIRHGKRRFEDPCHVTAGKMVVDITALLLAEQLGILGLVEEQFQPLLISSWVQQSLMQQLLKSQPHQPAIVKTRNNIVGLVDAKLLHIIDTPWPAKVRNDLVGEQMGQEWCSWLERVKGENGLLVDLLPLTSNTDGTLISLCEDEMENVVSLAEVVAAMKTASLITDTEAEKFTTQIGSKVSPVSRTIDLPKGIHVFLSGITAEHLARAELLHVLCSHCKVELSKTSEEYMREEVARYSRQLDLKDWLNRIVGRVRRGIESGRYVTFTHPTDEEPEELTDDPTLLCLRDMIPIEGGEKLVTWCDDRFTNRHEVTNAGPLITTFEVLNVLRKHDALSTEDYFNRVIQLRKMGVRHLPVTKDELLHFVRASRVEHGRLVETPELAILRMTAAAAVMDTERMQLPVIPQLNMDNCGELQWLFELRDSVIAAIVELWGECEIHIAIPRANWLYEMLHFDIEVIMQIYLPPRAQTLGEDAFIADATRLLMAGIGLSSNRNGSDPEEITARGAFFEWIYARVMKGAIEANQEMSPSFEKRFSPILIELFELLLRNNLPRREAGISVLRMFLDLPRDLQHRVTPPPILVEEFGFEGGETVVGVGGKSFAFDAFWNAFSEAFNGRSNVTLDLENVQWRFVNGEMGEFGPEVSAQDSQGNVMRINDALAPLTHESVISRRRFLELHGEFFDMPGAQMAAAIEEIVSLESVSKRILKARSFMSGSAEWFYLELSEKIAESKAISPEALMPENLQALRQHLYLDSGSVPDWSKIAKTATEELGLEASIRRFGMLPIRLPAEILFAVDNLDDHEFEHLMGKLRISMVTPIARLSLFHLYAARTSKNSAWLTSAVEIRDELLDVKLGREAFAIFNLILAWAIEFLRGQLATSHWHVSHLLAVAWAHAARLHQIHILASTDTNTVIRRFRTAASQVPSLLSTKPLGLIEDCSYQSRSDWPVFIIRGLGDIFSEIPDSVATALRVPIARLRQALDTDVSTLTPLLTVGQETETRPNSLSSFLGGNWSTPLKAIIPAEDFTSLFLGEPLDVGVSHLTALEADPSNVEAWSVVSVLIGDTPLPQSARDIFSRLINAIEIVELLKRHGEIAFPVLAFFCAQARHGREASELKRMEEQLLRISQLLKKMVRDKNGVCKTSKSFDSAAWRLIDAAFVLTSGAENESDLSFYQLAPRLIQACPELGSILRERLGGRPPGLPFSFARGVWPLYLSLRAAR